MKSIVRLVLATCMSVAILAGCGTLGVQTPADFKTKAYAAVITADGIVKTADTLLKAGKLSPDDAENIVKSVDTAKAGIAVARSYQNTAPTTANSKLDASVAALTLLTAYLNEQGAK